MIERPAICSASLNLCTRLLIQVLSDASQILNSNCHFVGCCSFNNAAADRVIQPRLEPPLLSRQPFHKLSTPAPRTPRAFTSFLLESESCLRVVVTQFIYRVCIPIISNACIGYRFSSQVYSQTFVRIVCFRWLGLNLKMEVIIPILAFNQGGTCWSFTFQQMALIIANQQWKRVSPILQCQPNRQSCSLKLNIQASYPALVGLNLLTRWFWSLAVLRLLATLEIA